jgi:hypothetical protein
MILQVAMQDIGQLTDLESRPAGLVTEPGMNEPGD